MFEPQNRYVTCGIDERLPQELQRLIWTSVDMRVLLANEKIDYLQVFTFKKIDGEILALHHEQEQHKARLVELQEVLSHVDEIEAAFAAKTEYLTVDDIFKTYAISREIVGLFVEKIVVDDTGDDIEIILKD